MKQLLAISDPYLKHSGSLKKLDSGKLVPFLPEPYPWLSDMMATQSLLIHQQLPRLKPLFDDIIVLNGGLGQGVKCNPLFDEYEQFQFLNKVEDLQEHDIWLCGFHYGRCLHQNILSAVYDDPYINKEQFKVIVNLSFSFPGDGHGQRTQNFQGLAKEYHWDYVDRLEEVTARTHK